MNLPAQRTPLVAALTIGPHDHFCSIYENREEHYALPFRSCRSGWIARKCIYIADDGTVGEVRQASSGRN